MLSSHAKTVVVVFCYLVDDDGRVLLIKRGNPPSLHEYTVVGGKKEPGEDLLTACRREVLEESSLRLAGVELRGVVNFFAKGRDWETMCFYFLSRDFSGEARGGDEGEVEWCPIEESYSKQGVSELYRRISPFVFNGDGMFFGTVESGAQGGVVSCDICHNPDNPLADFSFLERPKE
jgi:8-oxo-dGTP diphosphatase